MRLQPDQEELQEILYFPSSGFLMFFFYLKACSGAMTRLGIYWIRAVSYSQDTKQTEIFVKRRQISKKYAKLN